MILTCEECHARYLVPVHSLAPNGRKVRCGNCGHTWHENFPETELVGGDDAGVDDGNAIDTFAGAMEDIATASAVDDGSVGEPIPEGVRPIPEGSSVPAHIGNDVYELRGRLGGYVAAAAVFLFIMGGIYTFRDAVMEQFPPSKVVYEMAGVTVLPPMAGVIFDQVEAKTQYNDQGVEVLSVTGQIINLRAQQQSLAPIRVSLRVSGEETLRDWVIEPPSETIGPEETLAFDTTYPDIPVEAKEVNVQFTLAGK